MFAATVTLVPANTPNNDKATDASCCSITPNNDNGNSFMDSKYPNNDSATVISWMQQIHQIFYIMDAAN